MNGLFEEEKNHVTPVSAAQIEEVVKRMDRLIELMEGMQPSAGTSTSSVTATPKPVPQPVPQPMPAPQPKPQPKPAPIPGRVALQPYMAPPAGTSTGSVTATPKPVPWYGQKKTAGPSTAGVSTSSTTAVKQPRKNLEFNVGANLLAIIGVLFVIVALVTFGITMLPNAVQGVFLFIIFGALTAVSELFVRKRLEKFSVILTSLGIIGLYASTIVNYMFIGLINAPVALFLTAAVSALAIYLSKRRDSFVMRLILHLGVIACFFPYEGSMSKEFYIVTTLIIFCINLTAALLPVKTHRKASDYVHMATMTAFGILYLTATEYWGSYLLYTLPIWFSLVTGQVIAVLRQHKEQRNVKGIYGIQAASLAALTIGLFLQHLHADESVLDIFGNTLVYCLPFIASFVFFLIKEKRVVRRDVIVLSLIWFSAAVTALFYGEVIPALIFTLIFAVSVFMHAKGYYPWQHLVALVAAMPLFLTMDNAYLWMLYAAAVFAGLFFLKDKKTIVLSVFTAFSAVCFVHYTTGSVFGGSPSSYPLPEGRWVVTAILSLFFALTALAANYIKKLRDEHTRFYNYAMMILVGITHLVLPTEHNWIEYLLFLFAGLTVILAVMRKRNGFAGVNQYLILVIYLTYMIFMVKASLPITVSIALMVLSIASVALGFFLKNKHVRIYGLGLALVTCAKIAVYDFAEVGNVSRIAVFLVSGLLAIAISFLYIRLDKKEKSAKEPPVQTPPAA